MTPGRSLLQSTTFPVLHPGIGNDDRGWIAFRVSGVGDGDPDLAFDPQNADQVIIQGCLAHFGQITEWPCLFLALPVEDDRVQMFTIKKRPGLTMDISDTKKANDLFRNNEKHLTSFLQSHPIVTSNLAASFAQLGYRVISVQCGKDDLKIHLRPD